MSSMIEATATCRKCDEPIWLYCHSQAGILKAYAWSNTNPDEDEPRYGTTYEDGRAHAPERDEEDA